ncbi:MAG: hypothetical protein FPO08_06785 [Geobacter sp.]|nr:MAG: hypothetical protein FPO08_06785 [Geobacter sp.]
MTNDLLSSNKVLILQLLFTLAFSYLLFGANFTAQFGLIDDHEIISYLGSDQTLHFSEIFEKLKHTEVWFGNPSTRYRPSYYLLRLLETVIWDHSAFCWYAARTLMFWISVMITWRLCMRPYGVILGGISTLVIFSNAYWADIFTRLGPSEAYCALGLGLYSLAYVELWGGSRIKSNAWWLLLTIGAIVCMGSKENLLLLLPVTFLLCLRAYKCHTLTKFAGIATGINLSFGLFITAVVAGSIRKSGVDVYQNSVSPQSRIIALCNAIGTSPTLTVFVPFLYSIVFMLMIIILVRYKKIQSGDYDPICHAKRLVLAQFCLAILFLSQLIFYNGVWPTRMRYDFPGSIGVNLANIILIYSVVRTLGNIYLRARWRSIAPQFVTSLLCCIYFFGYGLGEVKDIQAAAAKNSFKTNEFMSVFHKILNTVKREKKVPIVLESNSIWDLEPIFSVRTYFKANGVTNPTVLVTNVVHKKLKSRMDLYLADTLTNLSHNGGGLTEYQDALYPAKILDNSGRYFVVTFSGESQLAGINIGRAW